jgi:hypothetical protein
MTTRIATLALALALAVACNRTTVTNPNAPSTVPGSTIGSGAGTTTIEFRVSGDMAARVKADDSVDGLTDTTTALPYSQTLRVTGSAPLFLSLSAQGSLCGFLHAQIFVNGIIFRDASSQNCAPLVAVDGTYRPQ